MTGGGRLSGSSRGQDSSVAVLARFLMASFGSAASLSRNIDLTSINTIRTLSMDGVQAANSGHPGTPI